MKQFVFILCTMFCCVAAIAQTISIDWKIGNDIYSQSTCEYGGDLTVPATPPTKYGYTFQGWRNYMPIEYLESTGTQYIDTGIYPGNTSKVDMIFSAQRPEITLLGSFAINSSKRFWLQSLTNMFRYDYYTYIGPSNTEMYCSTNIMNAANTKIRIVAYNGLYIYDQNNVLVCQKSFPVTPTWQLDRSLFLYALNNGNTNVSGTSNMRIYSCKIYDNDVLVRDFIPVLDATGTPCMYDKVEGKFYYNKGTGDFIAGPVISGE